MRRLERLRILQVRCRSGRILSLWIADSFASRLLGLAGVERLDRDRGMLIPGCRSVHTVGMKLAIDVVFVTAAGSAEAEFRVLAVHAALAPARVVFSGVRCPGVAAIELAPGVAVGQGIVPGASLYGL